MERKQSALQELLDFDLVFFALAHETRRRILVVLLGRKGEMTAGDIAGRFGCAWPTMTKHLQVLVNAGLVKVEKVGRERRYQLESDRLLKVTNSWLKHFEPE